MVDAGRLFGQPPNGLSIRLLQMRIAQRRDPQDIAGEHDRVRYICAGARAHEKRVGCEVSDYSEKFALSGNHFAEAAAMQEDFGLTHALIVVRSIRRYHRPYG